MDNVKYNYDVISNLYDDTYYNEHNKDNIKIFNELKVLIESNKFSNALEFGCGTGYWLNELYNLGINNILGIDCSTGMIKKAKEKLKDTNIIIEKLVIPDEVFLIDKFDFILAAFFISNLSKNKFYEFLACLNRHLNDYGKIVIVENKLPKKDLEKNVDEKIHVINETWGDELLKIKYQLYSIEKFEKILFEHNFKIEKFVDISDDIYYIIVSKY